MFRSMYTLGTEELRAVNGVDHMVKTPGWWKMVIDVMVKQMSEQSGEAIPVFDSARWSNDYKLLQGTD